MWSLISRACIADRFISTDRRNAPFFLLDTTTHRRKYDVYAAATCLTTGVCHSALCIGSTAVFVCLHVTHVCEQVMPRNRSCQMCLCSDRMHIDAALQLCGAVARASNNDLIFGSGTNLISLLILLFFLLGRPLQKYPKAPSFQIELG